MSRIDCPHCGVLGMVYAEHTIRAKNALTTYFCDACRAEWDESESGTQIGATRTRPPKTHKDKTS
jgi:DNA-directed RNA polymerase subunit RPC12/RpoP